MKLVQQVKVEDLKALAKQAGYTLLELMITLGIVGVLSAGAYLSGGEKLMVAAENVPTSSLQAADRVGQCRDLCAEILAHDKAIKAAWAAQIVAEQINAAEGQSYEYVQ